MLKLDPEVRQAIEAGPQEVILGHDQYGTPETGWESHKEFACRAAQLALRVERERCAYLAVNSSTDDYGSLSYVRDLILDR